MCFSFDFGRKDCDKRPERKCDCDCRCRSCWECRTFCRPCWCGHCQKDCDWDKCRCHERCGYGEKEQYGGRDSGYDSKKHSSYKKDCGCESGHSNQPAYCPLICPKNFGNYSPDFWDKGFSYQDDDKKQGWF